ncbi:MAG: ATP-binding protein [Treponema sp.]
MKEVKDITTLINNFLSSITPTDDAIVLERERRLQEEALRVNHRETVPERFFKESINTYKIDDNEKYNALSKARIFIKAVKKYRQFQTLIILGNVGTGKTHLACGIIRECGGLYRLASAIVEELRRAKSFRSTETEADILYKYGKTSLLVIDEIGRSSSATDEQYMIYQIINERYNRRKPTVLISNQIKKDFLQYIGIATADRLTESAEVVELMGKSYRAIIRQNEKCN